MVSKVKDKNSKIVGLIFGWIFGIIFFIAFVGNLIQVNILRALILLIMGGVIFPPLLNMYKNKFKLKLTPTQKTWIFIGGFILIILIASIGPEENKENTSSFNELETTQNTIKEIVEETCTPNWNCGSWSECFSTSIQTRTCTDLNNCGITSGKPKTSQSCVYKYGIGDRVVVDDIAYTLNSKTETDKIGEYYDYYGFMGEEADGIFYIFDFTIENVGDESETFWGTNIKIYDSEGRTFDHDSVAEIYLDYAFSYDQLQPGLPKQGKIVFDVPKNLEGKIEISSGDWLSDEVEYISWE